MIVGNRDRRCANWNVRGIKSSAFAVRVCSSGLVLLTRGERRICIRINSISIGVNVGYVFSLVCNPLWTIQILEAEACLVCRVVQRAWSRIRIVAAWAVRGGEEIGWLAIAVYTVADVVGALSHCPAAKQAWGEVARGREAI
jgi:hypothetical protein